MMYSRRLVFLTLIWLTTITATLTVVSNDYGYWQIALPLMLTGLGMPFFFVPLTALSLGSVETSEMASAAGLQNFLRTLSGAVATSLVTTAWEDKANSNHAELSGLADRQGATIRALMASGMNHDQAIFALDRLVSSQAVTIATNQIV